MQEDLDNLQESIIPSLTDLREMLTNESQGQEDELLHSTLSESIESLSNAINELNESVEKLEEYQENSGIAQQ